jgi:hypothetical protein
MAITSLTTIAVCYPKTALATEDSIRPEYSRRRRLRTRPHRRLPPQTRAPQIANGQVYVNRLEYVKQFQME